MQATIVILLCALCAVFAYPQPYELPIEDVDGEQAVYLVNPTEELHRVRRQVKLQGGGGGSPGKGFDFNLQGQAPVWQSNNGRHQFDVTGQYGQHLGGPYGNSRPQWGAGGVYTFRF